MSLPAIQQLYGLLPAIAGDTDREEANKFLMGDFSMHTRRTYKNGLLLFFKHLSDNGKTIEDTTSIDIVLYKKLLLDESGYASSTKFVYFEAVKRFYSFLAVNGFKNATAGIKGITFELEIGREPISMNEFSKMVDVIKEDADAMKGFWGKRNYALLLVYGMTGMRTMSLSNLKWKDLMRKPVATEEDDEIVQYRDYLRYKKKGKGNRIGYSPVHGRLLKALHDLKDAYHLHYNYVNEEWYIFSGVCGYGRHKKFPEKQMANGSLRNLITLIMKKAGIYEAYVKSPHSLRHMFLTYMLRETKDKELVKDLGGHSSTKYTDIYCRMENEANASTAVNNTKVFDRIFK